MSLNSAALNVAGNALAAAITHVGLSTDSAGTTATTAARKPVTWTVTNGDLSVSNVAFTGGATSGPVGAFTFHSALSGGTSYGHQPIEAGDTTFNSAGEYTATSIVLDASATD